MHAHWDRFFDKSGPFTNDDEFVCGEQTKHALRNIIQVLVIGAGGLGCELLKDLALSGFTQIHVIDMDTIDLSNLNRQFLFRIHDIGHSKAQVAARFIQSRFPACSITPHFCKIQDLSPDFYAKFHLVILGLDSLDARRWINATLVRLSMYEDSCIPIIDGGTEGLAGNVRVIQPNVSGCLECALNMFTHPKTYPICTIANTPRLPEHCITYAYLLEWPKHFPEPMDGDNPVHVQWVLDRAVERAREYGIGGVTYSLVLGVVKNIIPAIASTNACIAALCVTEAVKLVTACQPPLSNYFMYNGTCKLYTSTLALDRNPNCQVCGVCVVELELPRCTLVEDLMDILLKRPDLQLKSPSLRTVSKTVYMQNPTSLREATKPNLVKPLFEFSDSSVLELAVTDANLSVSLTLKIRLVFLPTNQ